MIPECFLTYRGVFLRSFTWCKQILASYNTQVSRTVFTQKIALCGVLQKIGYLGNGWVTFAKIFFGDVSRCGLNAQSVCGSGIACGIHDVRKTVIFRIKTRFWRPFLPDVCGSVHVKPPTIPFSSQM